MRTGDIDYLKRVLSESNPPTLDKDYRKWEKKIQIALLILDSERLKISQSVERLNREYNNKK